MSRTWSGSTIALRRRSRRHRRWRPPGPGSDLRPVGIAVLVVTAVVILAGCGRAPDPLANSNSNSNSNRPLGPTVLVEIEQRPSETVVATSRQSELSAWAEPSAAGEPLARFEHPIPTGSPLVFQVHEDAGEWLRVSLPVRPNGSSGWIRAADVEVTTTSFRIEIDVSNHRLVVWRDGQVLIDDPVAIGTGETPTPIGSFFLTELLQPPEPDGPYGTYAYGLSGFSETLTSFNGGEGVIGIHGTNEPASLGTNVSHGCVRLANETISAMAGYLPLGTPVIITP